MIRPADDLLAQHDRDLESRVANFLLGYKMPSLRHIDIEAENGTVIIRGRVHSFYQKQLCISCSRRVAGVVRLVDQVEVVNQPEKTPASV